MLVAAFACGAAYGQASDTRPVFEVASLRPSAPGVAFRMAGGPGTADPGRWTCVNWSLSNYLLRAYNVRFYQLSGPAWVNDARFDVTVKIPAGTTMEQFRLMLQQLLEERFKLAVHREKKEMSIFELVVAKGGHKMTDTSDGPPPPPPPDGPPNAVDKDGFPIVPRASGIMVFNGRARIQFRQQTMDNFAYMLSSQVGRPVIDATELSGKYALTLSWYLETSSPAADTFGGPTIFKAIQDQLGLRLEPKKGAVDMLVVDHVERAPIEN